jgi:hypothetical protein
MGAVKTKGGELSPAPGYDRAKKLTVGEMIHFSGDFGEDNANPSRGLGV